MPAPSLTRADVTIFQRSFERAVAVARRFLVSLTPREKLILQLGLHASHLEEALAAGDQQRAAAHAQAVVTIAQGIAAAQMPSEPGMSRR